MLEDEAILDGFDDLPPSDQLLDEHGRYRHGSLSGSGDGSFMHSHSEITDDDGTHFYLPLEIQPP